MSNIKWINTPSSRTNGAFITARASREASGQQRLNIYFSKRAVESLGLQGGERMLVGIDADNRRLALKPAMFGGNRLKMKQHGDHLELFLTIPSTKPLPNPVSVNEDQIGIENDMFTMPYPVETML